MQSLQDVEMVQYIQLKHQFKELQEKFKILIKLGDIIHQNLAEVVI